MYILWLLVLWFHGIPMYTNVSVFLLLSAFLESFLLRGEFFLLFVLFYSIFKIILFCFTLIS